MIELFRSLGGAFGIVENKLDYTNTPWEPFARDIAPASVGLTSAKKPGFFSGGIRAKTGSPWDHAFFYVGQSTGDWIKKKRPELLGKRELYFQGKRYDLGRIPSLTHKNEIIESGPKVEINQLKKYDRDDVALEMWSRSLTPWELEQAMFNAYLMVGMLYDVSEILSYVLPISNPDIYTQPLIIVTEGGMYTTSFVVCSTLVSYAYGDFERFGKPGTDWQKLSPGQIHKYMQWSNKGWARRLRNCKAGKK